MRADPVLALAWLALAHLVADFVIQTNGIATDKFGDGRRAWWALGMHWAGAALCLVPVALAFGVPGVEFLVVVSVLHAVIDRTKVIWTRRVEARAMAEAIALHEGPAPEASLGTAWTPIPAALFILDQLAHVAVTLVAWAALLATAPVTDAFGSGVRTLLGSADPATAHRVTLTVVVLLDLAIINVRAASLFVATLVHPREVVTGEDEAAPPADAGGSGADGSSGAGIPQPEGATYTLRLGPLVAEARASAPTAVASRGAPVGVAGGARGPAARRSVASPARVGATIGVLERLLIVALVMTNSAAAVGFVVAAKTLARFKQLDDRQFAEYYLLGTLASVSVALGSALIAAAALTVPVVP